MTKKRIRELADFFYSSDSADDVPLRLSLSFGMAGCGLDYNGFVALMGVLSKSKDLKTDLLNFLSRIEY